MKVEWRCFEVGTCPSYPNLQEKVYLLLTDHPAILHNIRCQVYNYTDTDTGHLKFRKKNTVVDEYNNNVHKKIQYNKQQ